MINHHRKGWRLTAMLLMISLLLTGCALLPTAISGTVNGPVYNGSTVTISLEEYERLLQYAELEEMRQIVSEYYYQEPDQQKMMEKPRCGSPQRGLHNYWRVTCSGKRR